MAPKDVPELRDMLGFAMESKSPVAIRLPRESTPDMEPYMNPSTPLELGRGEILAEGGDGAILAYGVMTAKALAAREKLKKDGINVTVANGRFVKPMDADLVAHLVMDHPWVLTVEDHSWQGGFGSAVLEAVSLRDGDSSKVKIHAIPDKFLQHADREELLRYLNLDADGIADVCRMIAVGKPTPEPDPAHRKKFLCEE